MKINNKLYLLCLIFLLAAFMQPLFKAQLSAQSTNPQQDSVGVQGRIPSDPPTTGATISLPQNGQSFNELPVTVSGLCPNGLLIKLFKNNVFAGSVECQNGSFSLIIDLFSGQNDLVARVYDSLDQAGPDSNTVTVNFTDTRSGTGPRVGLTSNYAKRGANPGQELVWPLALSGGQGPYAISVDWGDGTSPDIISRSFAGTFDIKHIYETPGVYNVIIKATDQNGDLAFLQLVGVANGPLTSESSASDDTAAQVPGPVRILWQPAAIMLPLLITAFWLGRKYELKVLRRRIERGERPF